ncbi:hypothetical protein WA158_000733 [Blastocystis sp. Blastoise]
MFRKFVFLVCVCSLLVASIKPDDSYNYEAKYQHFRKERLAYNSEDVSSSSLIRPSQFGADPTGIEDSSDAFDKAMAELVSRCKGHVMADDIMDCGSATIDLEGGQYLISRSIVFPQMIGNFKMTGGTIRATSDFNQNDFLIVVGKKECDNNQHSCNEFISFSYIDFDCNLAAAGALFIGATMGANVGPFNFFIHFMKNAIQIENGHETMIHQSWFGQYYYSKDASQVSFTATGVLINSHDHYIHDSIFFHMKIGVQINGSSNILRGVHTWGCTYGVVLNGIFNRLENCFMDYTKLLIQNFNMNILRDTCFLFANIIAKPIGKQEVNGFHIENSIYGRPGNMEAIQIDLSEGSFEKIQDTVINGQFSYIANYTMKLTQVTRSLHLENSTEYTIDFEPYLFFKRIVSIQYAVISEDKKFTRHFALAPEGTKVTVLFEEPVTATVTISVDESNYYYQIN